MVEIRTAVLAFKMGGISMAKGNSAPDIISLSAGTHTWLDRVPLSFRFFVDGPLASKGSACPGQRVEEIDGLRAWRDLEVRAESLGAALDLAGHQSALAAAGGAAAPAHAGRRPRRPAPRAASRGAQGPGGTAPAGPSAPAGTSRPPDRRRRAGRRKPTRRAPARLPCRPESRDPACGGRARQRR